MTSELLNAIVQWDVKSWSKALIFWEGQIEEGKKLRCLEIGSRQGGLSLWLALKGHDVVCSDLRNVEASASPLHKKYTFPGSITYRDIDATNIPYENEFDIIVFKSVLGGISPAEDLAMQTKAVHSMHKALAPGGKLLFAENLTATHLHKMMRKVFIPHSGHWRYIRVADVKKMLRPFKKVALKTTGVLGVFGRVAFLYNILSAIDRTILNNIAPKSWRYIVYGVAEK